MRFIIAAAFILGIAACARGPHYGTPGTQVHDSAELELSARFEGDLCNDHFSYLRIAVVNPSSEWQTVSSTAIRLPYASTQFEIVTGDRLESWAQATINRKRREILNEVLMTSSALKIASIGLKSDSRLSKSAGAALSTGILLTRADEAIDQASYGPRSLEDSSHILARDFEVPPGGDLNFWVVMYAEADAPLMSYLPISYTDKHQIRQSVVMPLDNYRSCSWQMERRRFLSNWWEENDHGYRPRNEQKPSYSILERMYQENTEETGSRHP